MSFPCVKNERCSLGTVEKSKKLEGQSRAESSRERESGNLLPEKVNRSNDGGRRVEVKKRVKELERSDGETKKQDEE